jgi:pimeloyl-ACP methyl ester carboxylesterase
MEARQDTATRPNARPAEQVWLSSPDGTRLFARAYGPYDAPVVVLVHGLGMSLRSWQQVVGHLADRHRVIAYDLRGHGRSRRSPVGDHSLDSHAADLGVVLARMAGDRRAVLVGHSLGGAIILARAEQSLDGVAGAVFAGSAGAVVTVPGLPARELPSRARHALLRVWWTLLTAAAAVVPRVRGSDRPMNAIGRSLVFAPDDPATAVDRARRDFLATDPDVLAETMLSAVRQDGSRRAPHLMVPALILHGDRDKEADTADVHRLLARLPDGVLATLSGKGHMLPTTDSTLVAGHIARWVSHVRHRQARGGPTATEAAPDAVG